MGVEAAGAAVSNALSDLHKFISAVVIDVLAAEIDNGIHHCCRRRCAGAEPARRRDIALARNVHPRLRVFKQVQAGFNRGADWGQERRRVGKRTVVIVGGQPQFPITRLSRGAQGQALHGERDGRLPKNNGVLAKQNDLGVSATEPPGLVR